ncbi:MAG: hypothetical protein QXF26_04220, partial [Candidatus Bathyarchaeia archaeon]
VSLGGTTLALIEGQEFTFLEMGTLNSFVMFLVAALVGFFSIKGLHKLALRVQFSTFNLLLGAIGLLFYLTMFIFIF